MLPRAIKLYPQGCPFTGDENTNNLDVTDIVQGYANIYNKIVIRKDIMEFYKNSILIYPEPMQRSNKRGLFRFEIINSSVPQNETLINLPIGSMVYLYYRYLLHKCIGRRGLVEFRNEIRGCTIINDFAYDRSGDAIMLPYNILMDCS